jgi:hypothetical protein
MVQAATAVRATDATRWAKALERALEECLDVLVEPVSGEAFVESATKPGTLYAVSASACSCPAGAKGSRASTGPHIWRRSVSCRSRWSPR